MFVFLVSIYFIFLFSQLPKYLICLKCFPLLAHLGFYVTFVSIFQLPLVNYLVREWRPI